MNESFCACIDGNRLELRNSSDALILLAPFLQGVRMREFYTRYRRILFRAIELFRKSTYLPLLRNYFLRAPIWQPQK